MAERQVLGDRAHEYAAPPPVIYAAVTEHVERWVPLHPGEVYPAVLSAEPYSVVWASMWPVSPNDTIEIELAGGSRTTLTFRWLSSSPPDERGVGITRQRLSYIFGSAMRGWLTTNGAWAGHDASTRPRRR